MDLFDVVVAKKLSGGGGDNPNGVTTINGTVANPWGEFDPNNLNKWLDSRDATAQMIITLGEQTGQAYLQAGEDGWITSSATQGDNSGFLTLAVSWQNGVLNSFWTMQGASGAYQYQDLSAMASQCPTTLTIVWHPLP